nr:MAG TPA: hypothetical protein [Caudoviricetes sp.]
MQDTDTARCRHQYNIQHQQLKVTVYQTNTNYFINS